MKNKLPKLHVINALVQTITANEAIPTNKIIHTTDSPQKVIDWVNANIQKGYVDLSIYTINKDSMHVVSYYAFTAAYAKVLAKKGK